MAWLDTNWQYRQKLKVINPGTITLNNYQVKLVLRGNHHIFNHAKSDLTDLRFTTGDGTTLLSHWIEYVYNTPSDKRQWSAIVWVKVPYIPTGESFIYVYYGNSSAGDISSGENTFPLFDDFEGTTLDTSKWTDNGGNAIVSSGILRVLSSGDVQSKNTYGLNYAVRARVKSNVEPDSSKHFYFGFMGGGTGYVLWRNLPGYITHSTDGTNQEHWGYGMPTWLVFHTFELGRPNSSYTNFFRSGDIGLDFSEYRDHTIIPTSSLSVRFKTPKAGITQYIDWVLVRKRAEKEVLLTFAFGYEKVGEEGTYYLPHWITKNHDGSVSSQFPYVYTKAPVSKNYKGLWVYYNGSNNHENPYDLFIGYGDEYNLNSHHFKKYYVNYKSTGTSYINFTFTGASDTHSALILKASQIEGINLYTSSSQKLTTSGDNYKVGPGFYLRSIYGGASSNDTNINGMFGVYDFNSGSPKSGVLVYYDGTTLTNTTSSNIETATTPMRFRVDFIDSMRAATLRLFYEANGNGDLESFTIDNYIPRGQLGIISDEINTSKDVDVAWVLWLPYYNTLWIRDEGVEETGSWTIEGDTFTKRKLVRLKTDGDEQDEGWVKLFYYHFSNQNMFILYIEPTTNNLNKNGNASIRTTQQLNKQGTAKLIIEGQAAYDGIARIKVALSKTRNGKGSLKVQGLNFQKNGTTRLEKIWSISKNGAGSIKIYNITKTKNGNARIARLYSLTKNGNASINKPNYVIKDGIANIKRTQHLTKQAQARIEVEVDGLIYYGNAKISLFSMINKNGQARLKKTFEINKDSNSKIAIQRRKSKNGMARLTYRYQVDKNGNSLIMFKRTIQLDGNAHIRIPGRIEKYGNARVGNASIQIQKYGSAMITYQADYPEEAKVWVVE